MIYITNEYGSVLIFDEVITSFRLSYNSSVEYFIIKPDMACFEKIIGEGLPVGAYGVIKEIMSMVSLTVKKYQECILLGNILAMYMGKKFRNIKR